MPEKKPHEEQLKKKKIKKEMKKSTDAEFKKKKKDKEKAEENGSGAGENGGGRGGLISDPRFSAMHADPRFQRVPRQQAKVPIDARFRRMFTDRSFASGGAAPVDKRGRPKKGASRENPLLRYYGYEEEEEKGAKGVDLLSESVDSDSEEKGEEKAVEEETESSFEDSSSSDDDDDSDVAYSEEDVPSEKEDVPLIEKETRRLAIVNMDWSHVKAVDLYVLLNSFLPKGGQILSVAVYPSEFGLQRMEYEAKHGPAGLFESDKDNSSSEEEDDSEFDNEKLRAYEKSRFRYYYAVVECDSVATADYIYKTCDGVEFERTSNVLDLRFIPDNVEFKHPPRDVAKEAPANYEALDFHTSALQQSQIHLTWDEDEPERQKIMKRKFDAKQLDELEFKEFLASDDGESDEEEENEHAEDVALPDAEKPKKRDKRDLYRHLLESGDVSDSDGCEDKDMEVTFNTGLEDLSKKMLEKKKDKKAETVWEAHLRERREKKKSKKKGSKLSSDDESSESDYAAPNQSNADDFFLEEPSDTEAKPKMGEVSMKNQSKKSNRKESQQGPKESAETDKEHETSRAELELLLADGEGGSPYVRGYNIKPKKKKGKKGKKGKEMPAEDKLPTMDYDDPRFSAVFTSPLFAMDPTDPQFKRSATYARQLRHKQQKDHGEVVPEEKDRVYLSESKKRKGHLSSLIRSIKSKVGSLQN